MLTAERFLGDFDTFLVNGLVDLGIDCKTGFRGGGANILSGGVESPERLAPPVDGQIRKHLMLDGIPFARSRRVMTHRDG